MDMDMDVHPTTQGIVAGADGSEPSIHALHQAPELTVALSGSPEAIKTWEYYGAYDSRFNKCSPNARVHLLREAGRDLATALVDALQGELPSSSTGR